MLESVLGSDLLHGRWSPPLDSEITRSAPDIALMSNQKSIIAQTDVSDSLFSSTSLGQLRLIPWLTLSVWCGLVSGVIEVGTLLVRKQFFDLNRLFWMSPQFIWLIPLTNLGVFLIAGVGLWILAKFGGHRGRWLAPRLLCALALLPPIWAASTRIFGPAGFLLALGGSTKVVATVKRYPQGFRRLVLGSLPVAICLVVIFAVTAPVSELIKQAREKKHVMPPMGSPNVLLVVLDTVSADHLSLYGYERQTSATMDELSVRGVRFNRVQATSSWTLPSHASMFTGFWPHELSAGWITPLDAAQPTLAEYLGSRGYATAGFAANFWYCAWDSGLGRGFTTYRDYIFSQLSALRSASLVHRPVDGLTDLDSFLRDRLDLNLLKPVAQYLWWLFKADRKRAEIINQEFLDWLSQRQQPERPFFAFLNYYDAHHPYQLTDGGLHRFGVEPINDREGDPMDDGAPVQGRISQQRISVDRDSYDNCIADLDEQIGRLMDELGRRGVLKNTWVIIAADHGESFGEHPGVFRHGTSLYQTELHVPLLILPPEGSPGSWNRIIQERVSLRDLAATVVDILGLRENSPFPGVSLARFWGGSSPGAPADPRDSEHALSVVVPLDSLNPDPSQLFLPRWPLASVTEGDWAYIRREGDVREELFDLSHDVQQQYNLAGNPAQQSVLEHMRKIIGQLTSGPLTPQRMKP